jgi:hypothetical protein
MEGFIEKLTNKNIENLCFPDLYKSKYFDDNYSIETITLKELIILKQKITNFTFKKGMLNDMANIIYEDINRKVYVKKQFTNMLNELNDLYGTYDDFKYKECELKGENKLTKVQHIAKFKKILKYNIDFILNNKTHILDRIEEIYTLKKDEVSETLKEKHKEYMKNYNARDDIKEKKKEYSNRDDVKEKQREYCNEKVTCECGFVTSRKNLSRHKATTKHTKLLNNSNLSLIK